MSVIQPDGQVKLYTNVPLAAGYLNTLYFSTPAAQNTYFHSTLVPVASYADISYIRHTESGRNAIRVEHLANVSVLECNYMAYKNTSFADKWFYGFVTDVRYLNNGAIEIEWEPDIMQSWLFDVHFYRTFVEREHTATDEIGDNTLEEPVQYGPIRCAEIGETGYFSSYVAVITKASAAGETPSGGYISGLFSGCDYIAGRVDNAADVDTLKNYLDAAVQANRQDSIINITMMPAAFYTTGQAPAVETAVIPKAVTIDGYAPKNKKLLCWPYNYLLADSGDNTAVYRYEWFNTDNCNFMLAGCVASNPIIALVPEGYNGVAADAFNYTEKLVMRDFPQVAWSIDSFRAWLAQDATSLAFRTAGGLAGAATAGLTGNATGAVMGTVSTVTNAASEVLSAYNTPPQTVGVSSGNIDVATRTKNFRFKRMQISREYAVVIDDFFNRYGYSVRRLKIPARANRPHWNYVKTSECFMRGTAPSSVLRQLESIYNNGITFWHNPSEVGDYTLDNSPV